jgi:glycosyltransferase involved in cell wall biosynthesis
VQSIANLVAASSHVSFFIFTRNADYCSDLPYSSIQSDVWTSVTSEVQVFYASPSFLSAQNIKRVLCTVQPDCVYVSGVYSFYFAICMQSLARQLHIPVIIAARGMLSPHSLAVKPVKKAIFLAFRRLCQSYRQIHFHATSPDEAAHIKKAVGSYAGISVIPNVPRRAPATVGPVLKLPGHLHLISLGRIAPEKGTLEGIKALRCVKGHIDLHIIGACYDSAYWASCLDAIRALPDAIRVQSHGPLGAESPELVQHIASAHALLMPSAGENYGHAIVECLSYGKPVVITPNTPWQSLEVPKAGFAVEIKDMSAALQTLVDMDHESYAVWSRGARAYYHEKIGRTAQHTIQEYNKMFQLIAPHT